MCNEIYHSAHFGTLAVQNEAASVVCNPHIAQRNNSLTQKGKQKRFNLANQGAKMDAVNFSFVEVYILYD